MKKTFTLFVMTSLTVITAALGATAKKQSAIQAGTSVRAKVAATGVYNQECYDAYYGCMDQFCISDNESGGSCLCSDKNAKYEAELEEISKTVNEAKRIKTEEVEKIQLGSKADIVFGGERKYDSKGNVIYGEDAQAAKKNKRQSLMAMFENNDDDENIFGDDDDISSKKGAELFKAANEICVEQMDDSCGKDMKMLRQIYQRQIESDCKGFANAIATKKAEAEAAMSEAKSDVRNALKDSFAEANKYNQGECMVEFKKCMLGNDACGNDWQNCVATIASENMQNKKAKSTAKTKVSTVVKYDITASAMELLDAKRPICERVLDQCMAVRDKVWEAFLREAAPSIKLAESNQESKMRQSCLTNISKCIQTACKDDIAGKGVDTMDACLSRPDMVRSFCKVEIDPCERMEPLIWSYVVDKMAAMRVDACTQEVKDCFTDDVRCGKDFSNCIGMDYEYIHNMCPLDKLVVCKQNNPGFKMEDLDSLLMGLYLNVDNSALENCQNLVDSKMTEICGSTSDCNRFASDDTIGTGSLRSQKDKDVYRITGMISFGSILMGDAGGTVKDGGKTLAPGKIGINDYLSNAKKVSASVPDGEAILTSIESELKNISGKINRVIDMFEQDPKIQFCVSGRNLEQITGKKDAKTQARFPNLLNQVKMQIAIAALQKAQENYNKKFNEYLTKASKDSSDDIAQYMCQMLPVSGGAGVKATSNVTKELSEPYSISYEVGAGLDNSLLTRGGSASRATGTGSKIDTTAGASKTSEVVDAFTGLGGQKVKSETGSGTREVWAIFNRENRTCHYCTSTVTKSCSNVNKKGFLGIGSTAETNCTESEPVEKCEDIKM
ncbi:MAG: hypothetical protein K6B71_01970 [Alphaproteobacteria bacterium]|nr:hypothetical protein [Alphaproteobacteria bacterium]